MILMFEGLRITATWPELGLGAFVVLLMLAIVTVTTYGLR